MEPHICPFCELPKDTIERRHRNTSYCEERDEDNYLSSFQECYDEDYEYYAEMWAEYYSGLL